MYLVFENTILLQCCQVCCSNRYDAFTYLNVLWFQLMLSLIEFHSDMQAENFCNAVEGGD